MQYSEILILFSDVNVEDIYNRAYESYLITLKYKQVISYHFWFSLYYQRIILVTNYKMCSTNTYFNNCNHAT